MKVDINLIEGVSPTYGEDIEVTIPGYTLVLLNGTKAYKTLKALIDKLKIEKKYKVKGTQKLEARKQCDCTKIFYIRKMLSELEQEFTKCNHIL